MSSDASATEIEFETEDEDDTVNTVYCKVGELVSVRRLAQHSHLKRILPFLPGVIAGIALFGLGHWLLALVMFFIGGVGLGWATGQPLSADELAFRKRLKRTHPTSDWSVNRLQLRLSKMVSRLHQSI